MKRVLFVMETISSGGVEQIRLNLVKALRNTHEFAFICSNSSGRVADELRGIGCKIYEVGSLDSPLNLACYLRALKAAKEFKPDIIHGGVMEGNLQAAFISLFSRNPHLILEETSDPITRPRKLLTNKMLKIISLRAKKFIGVSRSSYDYLTHVVGVNKKVAIQIDNAVVESPRTSSIKISELRKEFGLENNFVIGTVCRLFDGHKKTSDLIKSFSEFSENKPEARLLIVGDGPDRTMLENLVADLRVSEKVIFSGYQGNTKPFYDVMDVFALTSATEAFGLVLVEAMFAKLPIVATSVGGIPYVVRDGVDGILVPVGDIDKIAEAFNAIYSDTNFKNQLCTNGYQQASEKFSFDRYLSDVTNIYKSITSKC
ncbi:glycosyltransferase [Vibrio splendidus]|uniref:glycosyltransferase n=1 Tax=Vibrio splendidus TaxID=29497 RepID=UPI001FB29714|nr:glycosyltransferase [Vibrio splendidus]UOE80916.1 glycosyltransferase [Vibrio splendidus]